MHLFLVQVLNEPKDAVTGLVVRSAEIFACCADARLLVFDLRSPHCAADIRHRHADLLIRSSIALFIIWFVPSESLACVSVTNDGHCVLLADQKSRLLLVDKSTGQLLNTCVLFLCVCVYVCVRVCVGVCARTYAGKFSCR